MSTLPQKRTVKYLRIAINEMSMDWQSEHTKSKEKVEADQNCRHAYSGVNKTRFQEQKHLCLMYLFDAPWYVRNITTFNRCDEHSHHHEDERSCQRGFRKNHVDLRKYSLIDYDLRFFHRYRRPKDQLFSEDD